MRASLPLVVLLPAMLPCMAQEGRHVLVGFHRVVPSLDGHVIGTENGRDFQVGLKEDLGLGGGTTRLGLALEYQGPRFGLELSREGLDFQGAQATGRKVSIDGAAWNPGALLASTLRTDTTTLNWTIRAFRFSSGWLGVDVGGRTVSLELASKGEEPLTGHFASVAYRTRANLPQLGPSAGFTAFEGRLSGRTYFHWVGRTGAKYDHLGGELRFFPWSRVGFRLFASRQALRSPKGALGKDLDVRLDSNQTGLGVLARF